jgi:hypothetical protein
MRAVPAREANQAFSRMLQQAEGGEEMVITATANPRPTRWHVRCDGKSVRRHYSPFANFST